MRRISLHVRSACALIALLVSAVPSPAKKNDPNVVLEFVPQQAVAGAEVHVSTEMLDRGVRLEVRDRRGGATDRLGTRTDDDDRLHILRIVGDAEEFFADVCRRLLEDWGVRVDDGAATLFTVIVKRHEIEEVNQAVGATFEARTSLAGTLHSAGGVEVWSGTGAGDATRYGRKYSNVNVNEVSSDALLEAVADLLSGPRLHDAWRELGDGNPETGASGTGAGAVGETAPSVVASPDDLLTDVVELRDRGVAEETILQFLGQRRLSRPLGADDILRWQEAGVPEELVQAAMSLPVD